MKHLCASRNWFLIAALVSAIGVAAPALAADAMWTKTIDSYRVELHVLPTEPFFSKEEVAAKQIKDGMVIQGGAAPVMPDAASHPNHHLVVHIFDNKTQQAITDATVSMSYAPLDTKGTPAGAKVEVPVVVMQAIEKGPLSTHYGNNVTMPAGQYQVTVIVNGKTAVFSIKASDAPSTPMGQMKM
jgi:hypothetical protein